MNLKTLTMILFSFFIFSACSGKKEKTGAAFSLKISSAMDPSIVSHANGGGMVYGANDKGEKFSKRINPNEDMVIDLPNGIWNFYGILWNGDVNSDGNYDGINLTGTARCASTLSTELKGSDVEVVLDFKAANCKTSAGANIFRTLTPRSCKTSVDSKTSSTEYCDGEDSGYFSSYEFMVIPYDKYDGLNSIKMDGAIKSACYSILNNSGNSGAAYGMSDAFPNKVGTIFADALIPVAGSSASLFYVVMRSHYASEDCGASGSAQGFHDFVFQNGVSGGALSAKVVEAGSTSILFNNIPNDQICNAQRLNPAGSNSQHPFAYGSDNSFYKGICSPKQFSEIRDIYLDNNFLVLKDLNFKETFNPISNELPCSELGQSFIPVGGIFTDIGVCDWDKGTPGIYNGIFDGNNFTFINPNIESEDLDQMGLFREVGATGIIKNLKILRGSVEGKNSVGLIAGLNYGTLQNISINNSKVRNRDNSSRIGSLVGYNKGAISEINVTDSIVDSRGALIGGVVGDYYSGTIEKVSFKGKIDALNNINGSTLYVGGIVGKISHASLILTLNEVTSKGILMANGNNLGGIVGGSDYQVSINNAYSSMVISRYDNALDGLYLGGISGNLTASSVVSNSYFNGSLDFSCSSSPTMCNVGLISGAPSISGTNTYADTTFIGSANGGFDGATNIALNNMRSPVSLGSSFRQASGDFPRLNFEKIHPCENSLSQGSISTQVSAGRGSVSNPIHICNISQLGSMGMNYNYSLKESLNLHNFNSMISNFSGVLYGERNIFHNGVLNDGIIGLNNGVIRDVNFANINISSSSADNVGLVKENNGQILHVNSTGIALTGQNYSGLLVGKNNTNGIIRDVDIEGDIVGLSAVGGLAGENSGKIERSRVLMRMFGVAGAHQEVGGIAGVNSGEIKNARVDSIFQFISSAFTNKFGHAVGLNSGVLADIEIGGQSSIEMSDASTMAGTVVGKNESSGIVRRVISKAKGPTGLLPLDEAYKMGVHTNSGGIVEEVYQVNFPGFNIGNDSVTSITDGTPGECVVDLGSGVPNFTPGLSYINFSEDNYGTFIILGISGTSVTIPFSHCDELDFTYANFFKGVPNITSPISISIGDPEPSALPYQWYQLSDSGPSTWAGIFNGDTFAMGEYFYYGPDFGSWVKTFGVNESNYNNRLITFYRDSEALDLMNYSSWNIAYDDSSSPDFFNRIVPYYIATELDGGDVPANAPVWRIEPGRGGPELMLDF